MMKEKAVIGGAVIAGLLGSLCCIGPLLFVVLGVSAFGAATAFESARPYLLAGSVLLLALGYYWTYFRRSAECAPGEACATKPIGRANRFGLWAASIAVLAFAGMPYFAGPLAAKFSEKKSVNAPPTDCCVAQNPGSTAATITPSAGMEKATFKVKGMTCASCETTIKLALERDPGVGHAEVSYDRGEAVVEYDPRKTGRDKLRQAIDDTGYSCETLR
jgi:mercuric ion transport protein